MQQGGPADVKAGVAVSWRQVPSHTEFRLSCLAYIEFHSTSVCWWVFLFPAPVLFSDIIKLEKLYPLFVYNFLLSGTAKKRTRFVLFQLSSVPHGFL